MEQLNKVELKGNVGNIRVQDIGDKQFAKISLATNHIYKDKDNNAVVETTWHNIIAWPGKYIPENLNDIKIGMNLYVIGRLKIQRYTGSDGIERQGIEILAKSIEIIED